MLSVAHKSWWQIFEVVFGVPFLVALGLEWVVPLTIPLGFLGPFIRPVGVLLGLLGLALVVLARREFARAGQPTDPGQPTRQLLTTGVFSFSRNPLYLGGILFLVGLVLTFGLAWAGLLLIPALVACHFILILPEESYLAAQFGAAYRDYAATVHRWVGRK
jgi:protein-S-isoprenylcysteine O-methyltransferase Ste14